MATEAPAKKKGGRKATPASKAVAKAAAKKPRSVREAIRLVLKDAEDPMSAAEIYAEIKRRRLAPGLKGKTPVATVSAQLSVHGEQFERVGRGKYRMVS